jgi:hypothetical protein
MLYVTMGKRSMKSESPLTTRSTLSARSRMCFLSWPRKLRLPFEAVILILRYSFRMYFVAAAVGGV